LLAYTGNVRVLLALTLLAGIVPRVLADTAAQLGDQVEHIALDPDQCYRVLDLNFAKEDIKIYLASGYLIFAKPIGGARLGAIFVASEQAGDADLLLMPPTRSERSSLAKFTSQPTLEEHFKAAVFVFTDGTGDQLLAQLQSNQDAKKNPDMGALVVEHWNSVLANLVASFETRVVYDILSGQRDTGLFYMAVSGNKLDNFDALYDPSAQDQILAGKLAYRDNHMYFDTWTSFQARSFRNGAASGSAAPLGVHYSLDDFRIDTTIAADLKMQVVTRAALTIEDKAPRSVVPFRLSPNMQVTSASVDGRPVEVFDRESMRSDLIANQDDRQFLLIAEPPLDPSRPHELEIHHAGGVIRNAGNDVYYVGSRGTWYPRAGGDLAKYDLTFRYPKALTVAATGKPVEDRTDGDWRITRLKTDTPVRFAGFNLGNFQSTMFERSGYNITLYANRRLESALAPKPPQQQSTSTDRDPFAHTRRPASADIFAPQVTPPDPAPRMENLTRSVIDTLDFMTAEFGPTPIRDLAITPIPGGFGQGFPGLVYLSTLAYLDPGQLPPGLRDRTGETFFSDLLEAHEVAHQWWGNLVVPMSYHDDWLIESLANYSALLLLERKKGSKALDAVLDDYRNHLLSKTDGGGTLESAGPIVWGYRLESSLAPDAWRTVTYEKGTWIIHMLRRRLGDEKFLSLLRDIATNYHSISTEQFRDLAHKYAPASPDPDLKIFFDNWVYGTGIPSVKLSYSWRAMKLSGTLAQRDVDDSFSAFIPVEVQTGSKTSVYWLAAGTDPAQFSIPLKSPPTRVTLLAANCLMTTSK